VCNHDAQTRCINCPPTTTTKSKKKRSTSGAAAGAAARQPRCEHGPNGSCVRCLPPTTDRELDRVDVRCARHGPNASVRFIVIIIVVGCCVDFFFCDSMFLSLTRDVCMQCIACLERLEARKLLIRRQEAKDAPTQKVRTCVFDD
jgi:hypothetical protein